MSLKVIVEEILKEQGRSLTWLAEKVGKTVDGLRLGLMNKSVKYKDLLLMAEVLNVSPCYFFRTDEISVGNKKSAFAEPAVEYGDSLKNCRELNAALKDQLKDKERIISLLNETKNGDRSR
jgi:lambda repressor-like predicted transcriptional regulator